MRRQEWLQLLKALLKTLLQMQVASSKVSVHTFQEWPNRFFWDGEHSLDDSADPPFVAGVKSSQQNARRIRVEDGRCTAKRNRQVSPVYFQLLFAGTSSGLRRGPQITGKFDRSGRLLVAEEHVLSLSHIDQ